MKRALLLFAVVVPVVASMALTTSCTRRRARTAPPGGAETAMLPVPPAPMPTPGGEAMPAPTDEMDAARRAASVEGEKLQLMLETHLAAARAKRQNGELDAAREEYGKALDLDPQNVEAREGWRELSMDRPSTTGDYFDQQRREEAVRREQAAAEVNAYLRKGRALEAQEDFAGAIKEYQAALAIVSWYANQDVFGVTSESLRDLIDDVKAKSALKDRSIREENIRRAQADREAELGREREARLGRIRAFFEQANLAFRREEYATAREYAHAVLREDPTNADAARLIEISREAEHVKRTEDNRRKFDEEWKNVFADLEAATLPQVDVVVFPDNWLSDVAGRKARTIGDVEAPADAETKAAILATLESKRVKGLVWEEQNLDQVVGYLRTVTGLNFFVTTKVRQTKFDDVKVTLGPLDDVTVKQVLDLVVSQHELRWEPRNGVVTIALKEEVAGTMRLRHFDVKDLAVTIRNFRGTDIYLAPSNFTPPEPPELPEPVAIYPEDALLDTIKQTIDPPSWEVEGASIEVKNHIIMAKNTPENLDNVARLLEDLRANAGPLVSLEVRFITVEDNFLRDVGVDIRGLGNNAQGVGADGLGTNAPQDDVFFGSPANPSGGPLGVRPEPASVGTSNDSGIFYNDGQDGAYQARVENLFDQLLGNAGTLLGTGGMSLQHTFLDDVQMEVILRAVEKSERLQQVTASKITVYNTQRATVEVLNKIAYVADYEVEIAQASNIANPVIQNALEGIVLDVKPVVSADRRFVTLELRPTVAQLVRPIPTFSTSLASGPITANAPVIIQVPKLQKSSVRTTVTMPDGGTLLLGGLKFYEQVDATSEIPFLSKVPVLSFLLSRKGRFVNRRNLVVLITASVVALEELEPRNEYRPSPLPESMHVPLRPAEECDPCAPKDCR